MNIVLPILFAATLLGLFLRKINWMAYAAMTVLISLVIAYVFLKHSS